MPENQEVLFDISLEDYDLEILRETNSLQIFDVETHEEVGEFDYPAKILKEYHPKLNRNLQKEAQKDGYDVERYEIKSFLVLGKKEDDVNELAFLRYEDALLVATVEIQPAEVNGFTGWTLYLLGVLM